MHGSSCIHPQDPTDSKRPHASQDAPVSSLRLAPTKLGASRLLVSIKLKCPIFALGQLYMDYSRVGNPSKLYILASCTWTTPRLETPASSTSWPAVHGLLQGWKPQQALHLGISKQQDHIYPEALVKYKPSPKLIHSNDLISCRGV